MKFIRKLEAYLKDSKLTEKVARLCVNSITLHEINTIYEEITHALNAGRKYVEG